MSHNSKIPALHSMLESTPYLGAIWHELITTQPQYQLLVCSFIFAVLSGGLHCFCVLFTKLLAPSLIGYSSTPPITQSMKSKQPHYIKVGQACNYTQRIDIKQYNLNQLSTAYCNNKLSPEQIESYLKYCNKHHEEVAKHEQRFIESLFPVFSKFFTFGFGFYVVYDTEWLYHPSLYFHGWPQRDSSHDAAVPDLKLLAMAHIGWYIWKLFAQVTLDRHLKDFWASMIHHFTAMMLLGFSYTYAFQRVGTVVLLLHDPADIVLQSAKLCRLMKWHLLKNALFVLLVFTWFATRIVLLPYSCMWSTYNHYQATNIDILLKCLILLCVLYVLHIHWFYLIIKAVTRAVSGGKAADPRSDTEAEAFESDKRE